MDLIVRNARLSHAPDAPAVDIGVADGRIVAIEVALVADGPEYDAGGCLVCGGLVETHIHLDKSNIIDRCPPERGREANSMQRVAAVKQTFTVEDVYQRASRTLEKCIRHGATRMRTHLELDGGVEMRSFEAIEKLRHDYAWAIDIEVCVFPQEGLTNNPRSDALLVEGLKRGAGVIGAAPNYDPDHAGQIHRIFQLAHEFDVDIDMHLDSGNSPEQMDIHLVCELTDQYQLGGRVAVGHMCKLSTMPPAALRALARRISDAGVAVTVLPATELFMMGRDQEYSVRRGVADVNLLVEHGVNCSLSTNNVLNPFTPFGDASLLRMANLQANVCQISGADRLRDCFAMLTERSALLMNLRD
jgi:cytosine/creatinine deaminase